MIKVEATQQFTLGKFNEITNLKRNGQNEPGTIFVGDTFDCSEEMVEYLTGKNDKGVVVVKVIEIIPQEEVKEEKPEVVVKEDATELKKAIKNIKTSKKKNGKR